MKYWVGVTDDEWFHFLASKKPDEVNFWKPGAETGFSAIPSGAPFLFKLHSPHNFIVGGGYFVKYSVLPLSLAWLAFGEKNGTASQEECRKKILHYRNARHDDDHDPQIGCIVLTEPFFFEHSQWIPVPKDWAANIVSGKTYDTEDSGEGFKLWEEVKVRLFSHGDKELEAVGVQGDESKERYSDPFLTRARLGQGGFRVVVTDAYQRQCAISGEKTLPVLEAAHIKPYAEAGPHQVQNGLLLRSDLHILFDKGYVTVDPKLKVLVSPRIKKEFENGRDYYAYHGRKLLVVPEKIAEQPSREYLDWHLRERFLA
jgi:putative restriction endonuclease